MSARDLPEVRQGALQEEGRQAGVHDGGLRLREIGGEEKEQ